MPPVSSDIENWFNRTFPHLRSFWQRVTEGLELQELLEQFKAEARAGYAMYSREVDWDSLKGETKFRRAVKVGRAFFWAMLMKLSPARRVVLLLALLFGVFALMFTRVEISNGKTIVEGPNNGLAVILSLGGLLIVLALELSDRVIMKRDLEIARDIQSRLVPAEPPKIPGFDIAFATRPANTVAGDYYDAFLRKTDSEASGPPQLIVAVADVAGKGVPAALVMATFQASLRTLSLEPTPLPNLMAGLNRYACEHGVGGQRFVTAFVAEIDTAARAFTYVNAGHNLPILRRASGSIERLEAGGMPIGITPDLRFDSGSATLAPGDLLVIYTDGVVEAENETGEEYGDERLLELVKSPSTGSAADQLKRLMSSVDAFVRSTRQHDDITCLILQVS